MVISLTIVWDNTKVEKIICRDMSYANDQHILTLLDGRKMLLNSKFIRTLIVRELQ